jgi:hypothetical protein
VVYLKYLEDLKKYHKKSPLGKIKEVAEDMIKSNRPGHLTKEEEDLFTSAFDKIRNLELKELNLISEQEIIFRKTLTDPEEKRLMFKEAELTPEEEEAYEEYLKDLEKLKVAKSTKLGVLKAGLNPFGQGLSQPEYGKRKTGLIDSAIEKLVSIKRGKQDYSI